MKHDADTDFDGIPRPPPAWGRELKLKLTAVVALAGRRPLRGGVS